MNPNTCTSTRSPQSVAKAPAFQFYPKDWRNNAKLQRCSSAARGAWIDILCILHDADEYGVLRWTLKDVASAAKVSLALARELATKGVLKGADEGAEDFVFRPFHAGKYGDPIVLVAANDGPVWYCSRFVEDEWKRHQRGKASQWTPENQPPKAQPKAAPKPPIGERQGDGPASAVAVAVPVDQKHTVTHVTGADGPEGQQKPDPIWGAGLAFLVRKGIPMETARKYLGKLRKDAGDVQLAAFLAECEAQDISDPFPWLSVAARNAARKPKPAANDNFEGKTYAGTPDHELPESLR
jgi:hypothetical protein